MRRVLLAAAALALSGSARAAPAPQWYGLHFLEHATPCKPLPDWFPEADGATTPAELGAALGRLGEPFSMTEQRNEKTGVLESVLLVLRTTNVSNRSDFTLYPSKAACDAGQAELNHPVGAAR
jgi:hypothetical protein